ncbi:hypothetical protein AmDm5_2860 [Acetobacter malorum]|nr:hypothetical protein AmDm5_2860 [Acetobacter malorum]
MYKTHEVISAVHKYIIDWNRFHPEIDGGMPDRNQDIPGR